MSYKVNNFGMHNIENNLVSPLMHKVLTNIVIGKNNFSNIEKTLLKRAEFYGYITEEN